MRTTEPGRRRRAIAGAALVALLAIGDTQMAARGKDIVPATWRPEPPAHSADLVERVYVDETPPPSAPTAQQAAAGFIAYSRGPLELIFTNTRPKPGEDVQALGARACPGQYEPITLAVYALQDLANVRIEVTDLTRAENSAVLPAAAFDVRIARSTFKRITHYAGPGEFMYMPSWLSAQPTTDVPAGQSRWFRMTVHVPSVAKPGRYEGAATVSVAGEVRKRIPLAVEVLPFELAEPTGYAIGFYDVSPKEQFWPLAERFSQMRAHGMTSVGLCSGADLKLAVVDGRLNVEVAGSTIARVMDAYRDAGFTEPILWLAHREIYDWCEKQAAGGPPAFDELYVGAHRAILAEGRKRKWPEIIIQPEDECPGHPEKWRRAIRALPLLKEAGFRTEMDTPYAYESEENRKFLARATPHTDVLTHGYSVNDMWGCPPWAEMTRRTIELGKVAWSYNLNDAEMVVAPAANRWMRGFFFRGMGAEYTGQFVWCYCIPHEDPYNDLDGTYADWLYYYPPDPKRGLTGGPSIDYECMRGGIDDLRYILTLERLVGRARQSDDPAIRQEADKAQDALDTMFGSFDLNQMKQRGARWVECVWEKLGQQDGIRTAGGSYTIPNGWSCDDYDRARARIIDRILGLQSLLK